MPRHQHVIGFNDLPEMLTGIPSETPVYLTVTHRQSPTKGKFVYDVRTYTLLVQVIDPQNQVRYCMQQVAKIGCPNGVPWDHELPAVFARAQSAETVVRAWLVEQGYQVLSAQIALPKNLTLLATQLTLLDYDKTIDRYVRAAAQEAA